MMRIHDYVNFKTPVTNHILPDYGKFVTRRMDLSTISKQLSKPGYPSVEEWMEDVRQGLTLVHYSAQLEPFLTQKYTLNTPITPYHPPKHPRNNRYVHPLSHRGRLS
jgi:hypothetical protein